MIDVEADGPIPGDYSMLSIGAVLVTPELNKTFYSTLKPISDKWVEEAINVCMFTREQTLSFEDPYSTMLNFEKWILENTEGKPIFISDNNGFDWMFICWYFHHFLGRNPFGYSSMNLGSLFKGAVRNVFKSYVGFKKTAHTHNALDDAMGNAEAFLEIQKRYDLNIKLK